MIDESHPYQEIDTMRNSSPPLSQSQHDIIYRGELTKGISITFTNSNKVKIALNRDRYESQFVGGLDAFEINKPKKKGGTTRYFCKLNTKMHPYLATIEVVVSELTALVCGRFIIPKTRITANQKPAVLSKTINKFTSSAQLFSENQPGYLSLMNQPKALAKILAAIFFFENPDCHLHNWGIDQRGQIVMFDNGSAMGDFSDSLPCELDSIDNTIDPHLLALYPNLIYSLTNAFNVVSPEDLIHFPMWVDTLPYNSPFGQNNAVSMAENQHYKTLADNRLFQQEKYILFTSYLLWITPETVRDMIHAHSPNEDLASLDIRFAEKIWSRHEKIKEQLLYLQQYREFLNGITPDIKQALRDIIHSYNSQFFYRDTSGIKPNKRKFTIDPGVLDKSLERLIAEISSAAAADTPEKAQQREIALTIARIQREVAAYQSYKKALEVQVRLPVDANALIEKLKDPLLDKRHTKHETSTFFSTYFITHNLRSEYAKQNPQHQPIDFIRTLINNCQTNHIPMLHMRQKKCAEFLNNQFSFLFIRYGTQLSAAQIQCLWDTPYDQSDRFKINLITQICEHSGIAKIPAEAVEWVRTNHHDIETALLPLDLLTQETTCSDWFNAQRPAPRPVTTRRLASHLFRMPAQNQNEAGTLRRTLLRYCGLQ